MPPERKSKPKKALIAIIAAAATGVLLLLWVFVRHALMSAEQNVESAKKMAKLRGAWCRATGRAQHLH